MLNSGLRRGHGLLIPAEAGIQFIGARDSNPSWTPAFARVTAKPDSRYWD